MAPIYVGNVLHLGWRALVTPRERARELVKSIESGKGGYFQDEVDRVAQALTDARNEALEEMRSRVMRIHARKVDAALKARGAGRNGVASHRESDSETCNEIATQIRALKRKERG